MEVAAILTTVDEEELDRGMSMPENIKVRTNTGALVVWRHASGERVFVQVFIKVFQGYFVWVIVSKCGYF